MFGYPRLGKPPLIPRTESKYGDQEKYAYHRPPVPQAPNPTREIEQLIDPPATMTPAKAVRTFRSLYGTGTYRRVSGTVSGASEER